MRQSFLKDASFRRPGQTKVRNLQATLDVLGTEDSKVKEELQAALHRAKEHVAKPVQNVRLSPEAAKTAARLKVDRLEKAVDALGDYDGPELAGLQQALKKAREFGPGIAYRRPDHTVQGVHRAQREIPCQNRGGAHHRDEGRSCRKKVAHGCFVWLCSCRKRCRRDHGRPRHGGRVGEVASPIGRVPGPMPTLVPAELSEWISRFARSDECKRQCACVDRDIEVVRSRQTHVRVDYVCVVSFTRSCDARYGLRGVRVGEARNPGPPSASAAASSMETTRSSAPTGFRRLRPCRDESGRNVASRLTQPTQVDSVPLLPDTPVDSQVNEGQFDDWCWSVHKCQQKFLQCMVGASMQEMVVEDADVESVSQFDMTTADSEDGDLHSSPSVSPRHRLLGDSDTESLADGASTVSIHSVVEEESPADVVHDIRGNSVVIREAFLSIDAVDLHTIFAKRAAVMKAIPRFLRGSFRNAMRVAMDEKLQTNEVRRTRGWKLFLLLPRMLLHRPGRGGNISTSKLVQRFDDFCAGQWTQLLSASAS